LCRIFIISLTIEMRLCYCLVNKERLVKHMRFVLIGAGLRGMIYARCASEAGHEIAAVADIDEAKRACACREFDIQESMSFPSAEALLEQECLADAAIVATQDRDHWGHAIAAMKKGYHLLLEKPISPDPAQTLDIARVAQETGRQVTVCHVLRYAPFFREIKRIIDQGMIGRVMTIQHNENIGNFHIAHAYVRGSWRRKDLASSLIMQKSCHDMDLLVWLAGSSCKKVASFGDLTYFRADHAPEGAAMRCAECRYKDTCRFSAYKCYLPVMGSWPATALTQDQTQEGLMEAIRTGPYGRCVYHCDNDVCDHQVTILEFDNGVTATFNLSGFTNRMARTLKIMGEDGEIRASEYDNVIEVIPYSSNAVDRSDVLVIHPEAPGSSHGGGDSRIVEDFLALIEGRPAEAATDIQRSVESHMMACAAEEARESGTVVDVMQFRERHSRR